MKLYFHPGACSLSPHIVLRELEVEFSLDRVDLTSKLTETGEDFRRINPKGYVPALELDDGDVITEGVAIVQYLADMNPAANLIPSAGTVARAHLQAQLNFLSSELHKAFTPLFVADDAAVRTKAAADVATRFDDLERELGDGRAFLLGDSFSVADAYLFVITRWTVPTGIDLGHWPRLSALAGRIGIRPAVISALEAEGLGPAA
jgi:glutathione S-transferase